MGKDFGGSVIIKNIYEKRKKYVNNAHSTFQVKNLIY
jgi:hypothetical protein